MGLIRGSFAINFSAEWTSERAKTRSMSAPIPMIISMTKTTSKYGMVRKKGGTMMSCNGVVSLLMKCQAI